MTVLSVPSKPINTLLAFLPGENETHLSSLMSTSPQVSIEPFSLYMGLWRKEIYILEERNKAERTDQGTRTRAKLINFNMPCFLAIVDR